MPVKIKLATKGGSKKARVSFMNSSFDLREGFAQELDVVIEQLEIIVDFLDPAHRRQQNQNLAAHGVSDGVWSPQIKIWLHHNQLDVFALHGIDHFQRVTGRGRDTWLRFDVVDDIQPEPFAEVGPGT